MCRSRLARRAALRPATWTARTRQRLLHRLALHRHPLCSHKCARRRRRFARRLRRSCCRARFSRSSDGPRRPAVRALGFRVGPAPGAACHAIRRAPGRPSAYPQTAAPSARRACATSYLTRSSRATPVWTANPARRAASRRPSRRHARSRKTARASCSVSARAGSLAASLRATASRLMSDLEVLIVSSPDAHPPGRAARARDGRCGASPSVPVPYLYLYHICIGYMYCSVSTHCTVDCTVVVCTDRLPCTDRTRATTALSSSCELSTVDVEYRVHASNRHAIRLLAVLEYRVHASNRHAIRLLAVL